MLPTAPHTAQLLEMRQGLQEILAPDLLNIVEGYLAHTDAAEAMIIGTDGWPVDSEQNLITIEAIKLALTTASCDRDLIRQIFINAKENNYKFYLDILMDELRSQNRPIVLDNVNFTGMDLSGMNLNQASCTNARFDFSNLHETSLVAANLTDAQGLSGAIGAITINSMTVLDGTGLVLDAEKIRSTLGDESFGYVLADAPMSVDQVQVDMGGWKIAIKF